MASFSESNKKPLWLDEAYSYYRDIRNTSVGYLIAYGAPPQGSRAPLDYLAVKVLFKMRNAINYIYLSPFQYYRLVATLAPCIAVVIGFLVVARKEPGLASVISYLLAAITLLFNRTILAYAVEMRPYSLWASLSFLVLLLIRYQEKSKPLWIIILLLLALTMTSSIFQLAVLLFAFILADILFDSLRVPNRRFFYHVAPIIFAMLVAFYYILRQTEKWEFFGPEFGTFTMFLSFWWIYLPIAAISLVASIIYWQKASKEGFLVNFTIFGWIAMGPIVYFITRLNGFFFTQRQFIYYWPAIAILVFELCRLILNSSSLREFIKGLKLRSLIAYAACCLLALLLLSSFAFSHKYIASPWHLFRLIANSQPKVPLDSEKLYSNATASLPGSFIFLGSNDKDFTPSINLRLWWEWLYVKYPPRFFPRSSELVALVRPEGDNIRIIGIVSRDRASAIEQVSR
ncbi:MAG: hypothetical protein QME63_08145 [Actinomycetota bacterium]|nr:hypothetical protein [Actinomycetota bacterium]